MINKVKRKFKEKSALTVIDILFIFMLSIFVLLFLMESVQLMSIIKKTRDSLERATLSVAAMNEHKLYENFRENMIDDTAWLDFVTDDEVENVLSEEFGLTKKSGKMYKYDASCSTYYYIISDIDVVPYIDGNIYRINTSATVTVPIDFMGYGERDFDIDVSCMYASKSNAER